MNTIFRWKAITATLLLSLSALLCPAIAVAQTDTVGSTVKQGFNSLDYRLQKFAPNDRFKNKRIGDHMFITFGGGPTFTHNSVGNHIIGRPIDGYRLSLNMGDWFTPSHGVQLGVNYGLRDQHILGRGQAIGITADYLYNFTSVPYRAGQLNKFELIGIAGFDYQNISIDGRNLNSYGGHVGIQFRYYPTPSFFVYAEPRMGIFADNVNDTKGWKNYDWDAAFMIGMGYRMRPDRDRDSARIQSPTIIDNTFYGFSGGIVTRMHPHLTGIPERIKTIGSMYLGKWTSAISGWRLMYTTAKYGGRDYGDYKYTDFEFDYLFNINTAITGLNPRDRVNVNFLMGPVAAITNFDAHKLRYGAAIGFQGIYNINNNLQVTLEPKLQFFDHNFTTIYRGNNVFGSINVGLQYRLGRMREGDTEFDFFTDSEQFSKSRKAFLSFGTGLMNGRNKWPANFTANVSFGKWFSTVAAWRMSVYADYYDPHPFVDASFGADYMLSLTNMIFGYNPDRKIDVVATAGLHAGVSHDYDGSHFLYGEQASAQIKYNISPNADIFVEPQFISQRHHGDRYALENPAQWRFMIGVNYKFDNPRALDKIYNPAEDTYNRRNYMNFAFGPALFTESAQNHNVDCFGAAADVIFGRHFNHVSSFQVGVGYDFMTDKEHLRDLAMGNLHVDYVLDMTQLLCYRPDRMFHLSPVMGAGFSWSNYHYPWHEGFSKMPGFAFQFGLQFKWQLSEKYGFFIQPNATFVSQSVMATNGNGHGFAGMGKVLFGLQYTL